MTLQTKTRNKFLYLLFACGSMLGLFPVNTSAAVLITEIMYDAPGSDEGHEWVELTNTGLQPVDVRLYRFFEANTNHKLTIVSGNGILLPNTSAVVVTDAAAFAATWPAYAGAVLKSSFSLSNTGEALAIKNASSSVEDSISYASSLGAQGDGASLHRQGDPPAGGFVAALPNPGVFPGELLPVKKSVVIAPVSPAVTKTAAPVAKKVQKKSSSSPNNFSSSQYTASINPTSSNFPALEWLLGLGALIVLGVGAVFLARGESATSPAHETDPSADEFEIEGE